MPWFKSGNSDDLIDGYGNIYQEFCCRVGEGGGHAHVVRRFLSRAHSLRNRPRLRSCSIRFVARGRADSRVCVRVRNPVVSGWGQCDLRIPDSKPLIEGDWIDSGGRYIEGVPQEAGEGGLGTQCCSRRPVSGLPCASRWFHPLCRPPPSVRNI